MSVCHKHSVIGVLDSGVGGLTVASEIIRQLPKESIYYIGDNKRCPYGPRSVEEVQSFVFEMVEFLKQFPLKALVVACNTAAAAALTELQEALSIPVIGVIHPGARAAIKVTKKEKIGVIGTVGTIKSNMYEKALHELDTYLEVHSHACPNLATVVENRLEDIAYVTQQVKQALLPLTKEDIDTLILGCTHYPLLESYIKKELGEDVTIISSAEETAIELSTILQHKGILSDNLNPKHRFFTTGSVLSFEHIAERWLGYQISVECVHLPMKNACMHN
ncbi:MULTISPECIES: glutamate racemase [Bacillus]|uniref:Glutamate racemase n=1 Tax=Bacillus thuringiensis subsp. darmstadiensis TaxID=132264 RepID=A0A9X6ITI7_BACUD|nr:MULTISPECIES: glutamate racemase [Bacillus]MBR3337785.1 glutamate racemase [Bacillus sp. (in: firmicutes)]CGF92426.1 glutamate racemase [Streptococcus pneumoniae]ADH05561.1 glutamate racemase [Bacillus thuringiensis BMB171]ALZ63410.1 Glutamate racemase 1 [Bacillus cereus]ARV96236.1 glutamate racemase [Bacillus thuringiensis]